MNFLILILLFVLPFIVFPISPSFFETPKVLVAEMVIELLFLLVVFKSKFSFQNISKKFLVPIGLLFVLTLIDLLFLSTKTSFFGNPFRMQGIFLLWHLLVWSIISSQTQLKIPRLLFYLLLPALLLITFLMGNINGRAMGTLGEPNALAATAIFFWPFSFFYSNSLVNHSKGWIKLLIKALVVLAALAIVWMADSRSGLAALAIQLIFFLIWKLGRNIKVATIVGLILILVSLSLPLKENPGWFESRAEIWQTSLFAGLESPIIGQGFGNIESALNLTSQKINNNIQYQYVDSAHNIFLDFWVEGGIIGLSVLLFLVGNAIKNYTQYKNILELTWLLGLITVLSFNPDSVATLVAFWYLIGRSFTALSSDS